MRCVLRAIGIAVALAALAGCRDQLAAQRSGRAAAVSVPFEATFDTAADFYERFDYGYSGLNPFQPGGSNITHFHGDHNMACEGPTTSRTVALGGTAEDLDFSELFWHCAPGGDPAKGHVMTALDTTGYNIAWFSPKPLFSNVSQVCWDINATYMSRRKWTQVLFISAEDAVRYPTGSVTNGSGFQSFARGTGGFDLGFTNPDFRNGVGPSTGIDPLSPIAGYRELDGSANWFQDSTWTAHFVGPNGPDREQTTDKAARFKHCLTNMPNNTVRLIKDTPTGTVTHDLQGQIPQGPIRVVFQDDEYDGVKDDRYKADTLTWHWDNIRVEADAAVELAAPLPAQTGGSAPVGRGIPAGPAVPAANGSPAGDVSDVGGGISGAVFRGAALALGGLVAGALLATGFARRRTRLTTPESAGEP